MENKLKIFVAAGIVLVIAGLSLGARQKMPKPVEPASGAGIQNFAPPEIIATWLIREGYLNLRAGKMDAAEQAADVALFLTETALSKPLIDAVRESRELILKIKSAEAGDAKAAGNASRFVRANSVIERIKKEDPNDKTVEKTHASGK